MSSFPRKPWIEPLREEAVPTFSTRAIPTWSEPSREETVSFSRSVFTVTQPTSKSKPSIYGEKPTLDMQTECELQSIPRFKRVRFNQPKTRKSGEEEKRRNVNDIWLHTVL